MPCLSIKTDPLAGSVAWSIFHNYSSAWRSMAHPYLSAYSRSRPPRRLNVICRTKFDFDESMGKIGNERQPARNDVFRRFRFSFDSFDGDSLDSIRQSNDLVLKFTRCGDLRKFEMSSEN